MGRIVLMILLLAVTAGEVRAGDQLLDLDLCVTKKAYLLYQAQEAIIDDLAWIEGARDDARTEKLIAKESGVRDLRAEYMVGQNIVYLKKDLKDQWETYKRLGGKATTPGKVKHTLQDPCEPDKPPVK